MKKKILTLCLVIALAAIAVIGGTLAYFTDNDADVNVMTTGQIVIVQNETDRNGNAWQEDNIAELLPAVYLKDVDGNGIPETPYSPTTSWEGPDGGATAAYTGPDGKTMMMYGKNIRNEIDKVVSVTNGGNVDAYVRTVILIEDNDSLSDNVHLSYNKNLTCQVIDNVKIDDMSYEVWTFTYEDRLGAGKTSAPSLKQVWLDPMTDNSWYDMLGEDHALTILAFSQACQSTGFDNAAQALNTAFGELTAENIAEWVNLTGIKTSGRLNVIGGVVD